MGKRTNKPYYNKTNKCDICNIKNLRPGKAMKEYDAEGNWTGRWLCPNCWYHVDYKKRPDCTNNILKSIANIRTGNSSSISKIEKGKIFDYLICYCLKENRKNIERIYIFHWKEVMIRKNIKKIHTRLVGMKDIGLMMIHVIMLTKYLVIP